LLHDNKDNIFEIKETFAGTRAIGYSLSNNKSLLSLNLRLNDLGDYGGHRIFDYMMDNQVIRVKIQLKFSFIYLFEIFES